MLWGGAELLTQASRRMLVEIVYLLFARIGDLPDNPLASGTPRSLALPPRLNFLADSGASSGMPDHNMAHAKPFSAWQRLGCTLGFLSQHC